MSDPRINPEQVYEEVVEFLQSLGIEQDDILPGDDALAAACRAIATAVKERTMCSKCGAPLE